MTMFQRHILASALLGLAAVCPVATTAQTPTEPAADENSDDILLNASPEIEVRGERPLNEDTVSDGIRDIAVSRGPKEPRAQFADPLCLHVQGLGEELSERVAVRVRAHALDAGIAIDDEGCTTNAFILVVDRPAVLIERLRETMPNLFNHRVTRRLRSDAERREPVISWTVEGLRPRFANGESGYDGTLDASGVQLGNGEANVPTARGTYPTRLRNSFGVARSGAFVIFDVRQLNNIHIRQLADYATMQLLASPRRQIKFEELAAPTILTLFKDGPLEAPQALTRLDRAYLKGLYALRPTDWGSRLMSSAKRANANLPESEPEHPDL